MDNTDIKNKVVIITGAGSGIGEHAAAAFVREGAKVVMNGRSESKLNAVQKKNRSNYILVNNYNSAIMKKKVKILKTKILNDRNSA